MAEPDSTGDTHIATSRSQMASGIHDITNGVDEEIERYIQSDTKSKLLSDAVEHIESTVQHELCNLERSLVERHYVKIVLKLWLDKSILNFFSYLEKETTDISEEMPTLLKQLDSLQSIQDVLQLDVKSQLQNPNSREYLDLILNQKHIFETTTLSANLVSSYFNQFKKSCTSKVFTRCRQEIARDKTIAEKHLNFISNLEKFLSTVNIDIRRKEVGQLDKFLKDTDYKNGQELVKGLIEIFNGYASGKTTFDKLMDSFESLKKSAIESLDDVGCWTPMLQSLTKETFKRLLLPIATFEAKTEGGKNIVVVKGMSIFVSQIIQKMLELKVQWEAHEIQIVGLACVHIDCNLDQKDWHGTNVVVVTDKLFVDGEVRWDLSGHDGENVKLNLPTGGYFNIF